MSHYRVLEGARESGFGEQESRVDYVALVGDVVEWDGEALDDDGDAVVLVLKDFDEFEVGDEIYIQPRFLVPATEANPVGDQVADLTAAIDRLVEAVRQATERFTYPVQWVPPSSRTMKPLRAPFDYTTINNSN